MENDIAISTVRNALSLAYRKLGIEGGKRSSRWASAIP